jgi:predicted O-methyltransferase YrrM
MKFIVNGRFALYTEKILASKDYYKEYRDKKITSAQFCNAMLEDKTLEGVAGFDRRNIGRISTMPPDEKLPTEKIIGYLVGNKIISGFENIEDIYDGFDEYREYILANYDHGEFVTYVYPEDELLMYAMAKIARPKNMFMAGCYYGYLAVWAMRTVREMGGIAVLSDIDAEVCGLAKENFEKLGFKDSAKIYCEDAGVLLAKRTEPIDMLVLDATGRGDDPRPEFRGKRIYGALLKAAGRLLREGSLIFIHNMEPENPEMRELVDELKAMNALGADYDTFNGLGVYVVVS